MAERSSRGEQIPLAARLALKSANAVPYGLRPQLARLPFLSRLWAALLGDERRVVTVVGGPLDGTQLELDVAREKALWLGTHEPLVQKTIAHAALGPDDDAWDVGAHIGFFSLLLARRCRRVVAVEPNHENAARLRRNVELNSGDVEIVEAAVAADPGVARLELGPDTGVHRLLKPGVAPTTEAGSAFEEVRSTTLDEMLERFGPPALVKIDIEGGEVEAMRGATRLLDTHPTIICEVHSDDALRIVGQCLADHEYTCTFKGPHLFAI